MEVRCLYACVLRRRGVQDAPGLDWIPCILHSIPYLTLGKSNPMGWLLIGPHTTPQSRAEVSLSCPVLFCSVLFLPYAVLPALLTDDMRWVGMPVL